MAELKRGSLVGTLSISLGVLILLGTAAGWLLVPTQYEAFALLKVSGKPPAVLERRAGAADEFAIFKRTQAQMIRSSTVLQGILREASIANLSLIKDHSDDPVAWLNNQLVIDYPDDAEILRVAMKGANRDEVVKIVNKIVEVYLKEVVQRERDMRLEQEAKLQRTYQNMTADLQKQQDTLHALEALHNTSGSESARLKNNMAIEELNNYLDQRKKIISQMDDIRMQIMLDWQENSTVGRLPDDMIEMEISKDPVIARATQELSVFKEHAAELNARARNKDSSTGKRVEQRIDQLEERINERKTQLRPMFANMVAYQVAPAPPDDLKAPLPILEKKAKYYEEQLKKIDEVIEKQVEQVKALDNFNASVAGKQEDMRALQQITRDLRNELDRIKIEQLAPERIIKLDDAILANGHGDAIRRYAAAALAGALGLGLIAVGAAIRLPRER
jgi:hypothetical protein